MRGSLVRGSARNPTECVTTTKRFCSMPLFSIIIPAYNNERFLPDCLESVVSQLFDDWEAIVVVDGSPDDSVLVASRYSQQDSRISVVNKEVNEGTHLARCTGVERASGEYGIFLDADDRLADTALPDLVAALHDNPSHDVLRFGTSVSGEGVSKDSAQSLEEWGNMPLPILYGREVVEASFCEGGLRKQDWRILQRVYSMPLLKRAFEAMSKQRFGRGQDAYECFVISSLVSSQITKTEIVGYEYHIGRGITNSRQMTVASFVELAKNYYEILDAARRYAKEFQDFDLTSSLMGFRSLLFTYLMEDWHSRVADCDKLAALPSVSELFGTRDLAKELYRIARDEAYALWDRGDVLSGGEHFLKWVEAADNCKRNEGISDREIQYERRAKDHIMDLANRTVQQANSPILRFRAWRIKKSIHLL